MLPPLPAGTTVAFAVVVPVGILRVETTGLTCPVGHVLRNESGPGGAAVRFKE
jgi:hypothetical protein